MAYQGKFKIWRDNRVLLSVVSGAWDMSEAVLYSSELKKQAEPLIGQPWAHMVLLDDWVLGTPDIEPIIGTLADWCHQNQLLKIAHVYAKNMLKSYQLDKMVEEKKGIWVRKRFDSQQEAFDWMEHQGFAVNTPSFNHQ